MKKFNNNPNMIGTLVKNAREKKKYTKAQLIRELELLGIEMHRNEIYRIEHNQMIVLDINFNDLKQFFDV